MEFDYPVDSRRGFLSGEICEGSCSQQHTQYRQEETERGSSLILYRDNRHGSPPWKSSFGRVRASSFPSRPSIGVSSLVASFLCRAERHSKRCSEGWEEANTSAIRRQ